MPPKKNAAAAATAVAAAAPVTASEPATSVAKKLKPSSNPITIAGAVWDSYITSTPQRTKLIDVFMGFLVVVGVVQFLYCVVAGNYVRPWSCS